MVIEKGSDNKKLKVAPRINPFQLLNAIQIEKTQKDECKDQDGWSKMVTLVDSGVQPEKQQGWA